MDIRFSHHNSHLENPERFALTDPHLRRLDAHPFLHRSSLLDSFPIEIPGIYTLSGGRQVGKTTLMKQWMAHLLRCHVMPECIAYVTGELIDDQHSLVRLVDDILQTIPGNTIGYLIIDEVTYIRDWDKGIKYLADAGRLENIILFLTGSDLLVIKESRMRLPGRRGSSDLVDFHLYPLNFFETVSLKGCFPSDELQELVEGETEPGISALNVLFEAFEGYLQHGGFLTALNDLARHGSILPATMATYSDWIRGDVLKRGKQEHFLREILQGMLKRYGSQVTWNALCQDLSIDHPKTVADYIDVLESMDAVFVQKALIEDKLVAAPKKARKLIFTDPFIFHAVRAWLTQARDPYQEQVQILCKDPEGGSRLVESVVVSHYRQYFPTYYIKGAGEVDLAYVDQQRFWPVEVKWSGQLRPKDLKQITKYHNGRILTKSLQSGSILGRPTSPLPLDLLRLGAQPRPENR